MTEWQKTVTFLGRKLTARIWVRAPCSVPGLYTYYHEKNQQKQENKNLKIVVYVGMKKAQNREKIQDARRFGVLHPFHQKIHVVVWFEELAMQMWCLWNVGIGRELQISLHPESSLVFVVASDIEKI